MARTNWRRNVVYAMLAGFTVTHLASGALTQSLAPVPAPVADVPSDKPELTPEEALALENLPELPPVDLTIEAAEVVSDTDPLIEAIKAQDADALRKAIADGSQINRKTVDGSYPIIVAAVHGTAEQMKILTANNVDVHVADEVGRNGMHYAAIIGDVEKAKLMSAMRVKVNAVDADGMSPLYYAYLNKKIPVADFLVKEGKADINQIDVNGNMLALHVLKQEDNKDALKHMLDSGLSLFRRDTYGRTLVDLAKKMNNEALATELQKAYDQQLKQFLDAQKKNQETKPE